MARKAVLALYCLVAAAAAGIAGCATWAETRRDYPPSMYRQDHAGHVHGQPPMAGGY